MEVYLIHVPIWVVYDMIELYLPLEMLECVCNMLLLVILFFYKIRIHFLRKIPKHPILFILPKVRTDTEPRL
jgi:1-acyl-sn-glycerol-3-phosphate acyltransferase